jgi:hypothetical protein
MKNIYVDRYHVNLSSFFTIPIASIDLYKTDSYYVIDVILFAFFKITRFFLYF